MPSHQSKLAFTIIQLFTLSLLVTFVASNSALLIVDMQRSFVEGGSLPVQGGNDIVVVINSVVDQYRHNFTLVVYTLDFHPPDHVSFASQHQDIEPFTSVKLFYDRNGRLCRPSSLRNTNRTQDCTGELKEVTQTLWPDHCIGGTAGASLVPSLKVPNASNVVFVRKGTDRNIDSYSPFFNNGHFSHTELHSTLQNSSVSRLFIAGVASDFCVKFASLDAKDLGYQVFVLEDAIRGVSITPQQAAQSFRDKGIQVITSRQLFQEFTKGPKSA